MPLPLETNSGECEHLKVLNGEIKNQSDSSEKQLLPAEGSQSLSNERSPAVSQGVIAEKPNVADFPETAGEPHFVTSRNVSTEFPRERVKYLFGCILSTQQHK